MKRYKYFYEKNLNRQSDCFVPNPRIFKGEAIQVLLRQKIWIVKAIVSFQTKEFLKMKPYKYFYTQKFESTKRLYRFKPQNLLEMKRYNYFTYYLFITFIWSDCMSAVFLWGMRGFTDLILP
jgi:hypothetical protein